MNTNEDNYENINFNINDKESSLVTKELLTIYYYFSVHTGSKHYVNLSEISCDNIHTAVTIFLLHTVVTITRINLYIRIDCRY
jgi:hypothetical protein